MATLKEISQLTGVAGSTISRVLNRDPSLSISDEKRALVIEAAEKLQYVTPRQRRGGANDDPLRIRRPRGLVSLVLVHFLTSAQEMSRPFYLGLRQGIEARCEAYGINIVRVLEQEFDPASLLRGRDSGILSIGPLAQDMVDAIEEHAVPLVLVHPAEPPTPMDLAYVDITAASVMLCDWLLGRGVVRPALVGLASANDARLTGYRQVMERAGGFDPDYTIYETGNGETLIDDLFARLEQLGKPLPDALIVQKDHIAVEVYQALQQRGLRIPEDISVAGFNDSAVAGVLRPKLTTIRLDAGEIGAAAVDLLMERLAGRTTAKHVQIQPVVTVRASTL
ncbi:LacI family DNA-binding transcriptional regulator [Oceaniglobus ichthyenteri]|uniref:LacI family DNA-binding transcriptional regulator n=1 Tax=Oceaniglobus ichthyenteri TaxID=2136177 RepID=UPI000D33F8EE|nr:LacI family DNA-binding transcriptional regulator [Oceaniglobus ichthyenteri]